jgi:formylglycine-generating enzyme
MSKVLLIWVIMSYALAVFAGVNIDFQPSQGYRLSESIQVRYRTASGAVQDLNIEVFNFSSIRLDWQDLDPADIGSGLVLQGYLVFAAQTPDFECNDDNLIGITAYSEFVHQSILGRMDKTFYCVVAYMTPQIPDSFVLVNGGRFDIGYQTTNSVRLNSFYLDKYELTQGEYQRVMGSSPSLISGVGANHPIYNVTWFNAIEYCNRRSIMEGLKPSYTYSTFGVNPDNWPTGWNTNTNHASFLFDWTAEGYRLPTEAEWEFAARGGLSSAGYLYSGSNIANEVAWTSANSPSGTRPVGGKLPNELGLYDMSGNVAEWCWDISISDAYPPGPHGNPTGSTSGANRVSRNGGWSSDAFYSSFYYRLRLPPSSNWNGRGFRICRSVPNFVLVEGGTFHNGSSEVTVSSFYVDKFELTQDSFRILMGNPISFSNGAGSSVPAYATNWFVAIDYCNRRSIADGFTPCYSYLNHGTDPANWPYNWYFNTTNKSDVSCDWTADGYRLPTEAEWLFAGMGGLLSHGYTYSGSNNYYDVAVTGLSSPKGVGIGIPNELGIYDMTGNVHEWVWDYFDELPTEAQINPRGPDTGTSGTRKGGAYSTGFENSSLLNRSDLSVSGGIGDGGFRLVRNAD